MTNWSELDDLGLSEEPLDEYDPLAPMSGAGDSEPSTEDDLGFGGRSTLLNSEGQFDLSGGFIDAAGVVRLWIDDEGSLTKVRVSPSWREKLGKSGKAKGALEGAFATAFASIHAYQLLTAEEPVMKFTSDEEVEAPGPMSWEALGAANNAMEELYERLDAIPRGEGHGSWRGEPAIGHSQDRKVQVQLALEGSYGRVTFDELWLDASRVSQITSGVLEASRSAKSKFVKPEYVPGERDEIDAEARSIRDNLRAMMKRGFN